ncbi:ABC transporter permease [Lipingzhangella sp. LS1_29]|uniref:ABC transporter permease n=1 Tax=Lipingzhangella rawalii TaxID=2055835 RepID=A0ABU2H2B7_9ACTN|nr:ABC transporter permease [Lipingzhangella rawalii]MDS1269436.1 ABC transporter permease [Lipingzhangella rawalii]
MSISSVPEPPQPTSQRPRQEKAAHWCRSYGLLARWTLMRLRSFVPLMVIVQVILSVSIVFGFAFLNPGIDADPEGALFLSTGAPTLALIAIGLGIAPGQVAQQKAQGILDYQRALPVPRTATLAAEATVWVGIALPGVAAGLWAATLRFDLELQIHPLLAPALVLVALTCLAVGYGIAYTVPPMVVQVVTNLLLFLALLFSPVNFPADRLPGWLATAHTFLPFAYMAQVIRESLAPPPEGISVLPFAVLSAWCLLGLTLAHWVMNRRG